MKRPFSLLSCFLICVVLVQYRACTIEPAKPLKITTWDAFGYYAYLPATLIYHDYKHLSWLDTIDHKYQLTGGDGWQALKLDNGNYTFKYLGGVAVMELPLFLAAHLYAKNSSYPADGFSAPYQYALGFGVILYCLLALLLLRKVLLRYFSDVVTTITLLLVCLASNFIQYAAVDNAESHVYIFLLYALVLYASMKWHEQPKVKWAILIGWIIGLATMSRPTEAIMLFIPLLWNTHNRLTAKEKWRLVFGHKAHVAWMMAAGLAGVLPQLIYWKLSTGSWMYDVGSKWRFFNPWFRVLVGWEKGWFIYTPATLLFVAGLFFIRKYQFRNSVLWFCILNIWIVIAWEEWRYGGSYSTRALVQSYPVFALALAALIQRVMQTKWRLLLYAACLYLTGVNLFQIWQYNKTIIHYDDMNRIYYSHVYLNPNPSPAVYSLLDSNEYLNNESGFRTEMLGSTSGEMHFKRDSTAILIQQQFRASAHESWLKINATLEAPGNLWGNYLEAELRTGNTIKRARTRLFPPMYRDQGPNNYTIYMKVPSKKLEGSITVLIHPVTEMNGRLLDLKCTLLER